MSKLKKIPGILGIVLAVTAFTIGCSSTGTTELTGAAVKGLVVGGTVTVYMLNTDGSLGAEIASATTLPDGSFRVNLGEYTGAAAVVVSGGSYVDEATGVPITLADGKELVTLLSSTSDGMSVAATALTTIAATNAVEHASADGLAAAIDNANTALATAFGLDGLDISEVIPADLTQSVVDKSSAAIAYGAVQSGLSQFVWDNENDPADVLNLIIDMASEFADGAFDGERPLGSDYIALITTPVEALNGLTTSIQTFLSGARNVSGVVFDNLSISVPTITIATP